MKIKILTNIDQGSIIKKNMAMLVALSLILVMLINFPILPAIPFMKYDPADIPILIGSFLFGPMGGVILTAIVSILQGLFISGDGGPIGIVMHFLATSTFAYQRTKTKRSAVVGLICGALSMTCVMVICNLLLTPIFLGAPMEKVIELLLPAIIPFNLIKASINALITYFIYKPISNFVHRNI